MRSEALFVAEEAVLRAVERILRPIVEGQIRGFLKEHPSIVAAVDWYKPRKDDKATTFTNSLSKRIVRDLACGSTTARLVAALLELAPETQPNFSRGMGNCGEGGHLGISAEMAALCAAVEAGTYRPDHSEIDAVFGRRPS